MASEENSQWYFTDTELAATPSVADGLPIVEEKTRRAKAVNFIIQAGILLKLPQLTLATASVFLHRFYMRHSMVPEKNGLHHYNIAATALFLATKTEENCRKTKEIVIAVAKVAQKNASLIIDEQSKEYWRWRDNILLYEELMLEFLTFDVVLQSPYNHLYSYLQKLQVEENKPLRNIAWAFLNDSCLTMMCLMMPAQDIAAGAIYFAAKGTKTQIMDDGSGLPWWEQIGGKADLITKAVGVMNDFYTENPLRKTDNPYGQSPTSGNEDDLEKTRARGFSNERTPIHDGTQSQRSQNGHAETPMANGDISDEHNSSQSEENGKPASHPSQLAPSEATAPELQPRQDAESAAEAPGSSDVALKEAANDPATHETTVQSSGDSLLTNQVSQDPGSLKRKDIEDGEEPAMKRPKSESDSKEESEVMAEEIEAAPTAASVTSEEGELEE